MEDKLIEKCGVENLTEAETQNIDGGGLLIGWFGNLVKVGAGIGAGYLLASSIDHC